jgi:hypothetical protein
MHVAWLFYEFPLSLFWIHEEVPIRKALDAHSRALCGDSDDNYGTRTANVEKGTKGMDRQEPDTNLQVERSRHWSFHRPTRLAAVFGELPFSCFVGGGNVNRWRSF